MASKAQRTGILIAVLLFVAASLSTTGFVLWEMYQNDNETRSTEASVETETADTNQQQEDGLKGTKLENYEPVAEVTELQKIDLVEGTGEEVQPGATVTAHYTGALATDGTIFESSKDSGQPATFPLANVIKGWQEGVPGMKVGGTRRLIIPAAQAYGEQGSPPAIPPNTPLVFDIELVSIGE